MKILLVYPKYPATFWSFKYAIEFVDKKVISPPLGLLTVAALLPGDWEKKLIDLNFETLTDNDLRWADYLFITALDTQKESCAEVIERCKKNATKVVAGGPFFSENYKDFPAIDHVFIGEAEDTMPEFLKDLENNSTKRVYSSSRPCDLTKSPIPLYHLLKKENYAHLSLQLTRGCPFNCEFCSVSKIFGKKVRIKTKEQVIGELSAIFETGWRAGVMFSDDNLIGNIFVLKNEILPAMIQWNRKTNHTFKYLTQLSINLADDEELMRMMVDVGFETVFLGIETVDDDCLAETGKFQNRNRDILADVKKMQRFGLEVWSGFILGFDHDKETVFDNMIRFIQESGITVPMPTLLTPIRGTRLHERLEKENRLMYSADGKDLILNFKPKMKLETLIEGYRRLVRTVWSPERYYARLLTFLKEVKPKRNDSVFTTSPWATLKIFIRVIWVLGILDKGRYWFWKLFFRTLLTRPEKLRLALALWVYGYHFRKADSYQLQYDVRPVIPSDKATTTN
jgi:radical SAM superfamily enzyme YgiQ (UPF0313 family)